MYPEVASGQPPEAGLKPFSGLGAQWLLRSQACSLSLRLNTECPELLKIIVAHCRRWEEVDIEVPFGHMSKIEGEMPLLWKLQSVRVTFRTGKTPRSQCLIVPHVGGMASGRNGGWLGVGSPGRPAKGLPTVPVKTGVTGAVNGMPSRLIEASAEEKNGTGAGRQSLLSVCCPSRRQKVAVDGH
ncbi:hypothetical protein C8R43DRAFT_952024 [Mycena crocata]|nr:hypothetical protein C8R43DRAFT_952024 [Mycena crocata]